MKVLIILFVFEMVYNRQLGRSIL